MKTAIIKKDSFQAVLKEGRSGEGGGGGGGVAARPGTEFL